MMVFQPRPKQKEVLRFRSGRMGVAAVPGSGKTRTLSYLAATLLAELDLADDQEILIVTLVNAAADHFSRQVGAFVEERGLLPGFGYRVRTLHALANDIVRERPGLVGLQADFRIVDERESVDILQDAVDQWLKANPDAVDAYLHPDLEPYKQDNVRRDAWPKALGKLAAAFIRTAKDRQLDPADAARALDAYRGPDLPLAAACVPIYLSYQRSLDYRGGVDFQDLIRLALRALHADGDFLARLRHRWPVVLEDEAQDSSQLQEGILSLLVGGRGGNWVRVGDPNQAIYETFTTARPEHLRDFINKSNVKSRELPDSGRSQPAIIDLANALIEWTAQHPVAAVRERHPLNPPLIRPTPPGDPQPNPPADASKVILYNQAMTPQEELSRIVQSLGRWLPENPDATVAVLAPRNDRGAEMVKALKTAGIETFELLKSTATTRETAGALTHILTALSEPSASNALAKSWEVWRRDDREDPDAMQHNARVVKALKGLRHIEDYLYPRAGSDWLDGPAVAALLDDDPDAGPLLRELLLTFRTLMRRWQAAVMLPIDQLVLTISGDLFSTQADLAIAHSLAVYLKQAGQNAPHWRLPDYRQELSLVALNKRRVMDLAQDADQHDPDKHRGKVTVATMHGAKGLEWDRVYLMSVNNYDFPSAEPQDRFIGEPYWARDRLNLEAEALAQLDCLIDGAGYDEGLATEAARVDYAAERLRLLYVGITRARRELTITWNTGRDGRIFPATPLLALADWWERYRSGDVERPPGVSRA